MGKTDLMVSELGFGGAQIGGPSLINGKPYGSKPISGGEASAILSMAKDAGITFYDSSDMYGDGLSESRLGEFFKGTHDVVIATKCGFTKSGNRDFSPGYIAQAVEGSLRRLQRDRIDLYQFSKPTAAAMHTDDLAETVVTLKRQGKIAYAGISVGTVEDGLAFLKYDVWDSLQIIYNLLTLDFKKLISAASRQRVGVIIRSPLSSGMLTGQFDESSVFPESDDRSMFLYGKTLIARAHAVRELKKQFGLSNEELAVFSMNFLVSDGEVDTIIPGATSTVQMAANLRLLEQPRFTKQRWKEIYDFASGLAAAPPA